MLNVSTLKLVTASLERWNSREALKWAKTRLRCPTHRTIESVTDFRPMAKLAVLACGCKRPIALMTDQERHEYDEALTASKKRRLVKSSATCQVFEQDEAA
jgi:hypothetical protein